MKHRRPQHAFTLIELLVAISIMLILLVITQQIFQDASSAVSRGSSLSDVMTANRSVTEQLDLDSELMLAPSATGTAPGLLMMVNRFITAEVIDPVTGARSTRKVRSDQLLFIRNTSGAQASVPGSDDALSPSPTVHDDPGHVAFSRVWYGHLLRTAADGTGPGATLGNSPNRTATHWSLGRQLLFLHDPDETLSGTQADDATYNADVSGGMTIPVTPKTYMGVADVAALKLAENGVFGSLTTVPNAVIATNTSWLSSELQNYQLYTDMSHGDYRPAAYELLFLNERLRFNPTPQIPAAPGPLASWQIAQTHPLLARNVSDFIVEFAADTDNDGDIDRDGSQNIEWFGLGNLVSGPYDWTDGTDRTDYDPEHVVTAGSEVRYLWRHDDDQNNPGNNNHTKWPHLIRIRWRMHDTRGELTHTNLNTPDDNAGVWYEKIIPVNRP